MNGSFQFNCRVMCVECVYKVSKLVKCMGPGAYNVIQEALVEQGLEGAFCKGFLLPLAHVYVCI